MQSFTLMPHQKEALEFLKQNDGIGLLAMEPGTGKTLVALEFLKEHNAFPAIIIAPVTILGMWKKEIEKWYPYRVSMIRGTKLARFKAYNTPADIYLMGYETFRNEWQIVRQLEPVTCILDESGKVRTPTAKISKAIRAFHTQYRIALDGTPVSNSLADLWNISEWMRPGIFFGNWWKFRGRYAMMNPYIPGKIDGWRDADQITKTANERIFWKKKIDVLKDLPPVTQTDLILETTPEERKIYKRIKEELRIEIDGEEITIANALALLMRLRQAANGVWNRPDIPTKTKAVIDLIASLPSYGKIVIFSQFEEVIEHLSKTLPFKTVKVTGAVDMKEREQAVQLFESDPDCRAILMTSAGEKGLNLQCASYMIQYDLVWSAASEEQRIGRIWRHGQEQACTIWNLLADGTVDLHMRRILSRKKDLAEKISIQDIYNILE